MERVGQSIIMHHYDLKSNVANEKMVKQVLANQPTADALQQVFAVAKTIESFAVRKTLITEIRQANVALQSIKGYQQAQEIAKYQLQQLGLFDRQGRDEIFKFM